MRDIRLSFSMPLARLSPPPFLPLNRSIPVFRALSVFLPRFVSRAPLTMSLYYALLTQRDQRDIPFRFPLRAGLIDKSLRLAIAYIRGTPHYRTALRLILPRAFSCHVSFFSACFAVLFFLFFLSFSPFLLTRRLLLSYFILSGSEIARARARARDMTNLNGSSVGTMF
jgi:hypothetical protein